MLFIIVSTTLFSIDEAQTVVHGCSNRKTILIEQASIAIVIITLLFNPVKK